MSASIQKLVRMLRNTEESETTETGKFTGSEAKWGYVLWMRGGLVSCRLGSKQEPKHVWAYIQRNRHDLRCK